VCAFCRAKSWKVIGGLPVSFSMSSFGRELLPEMMVPVSQRSITVSSADTKPAAIARPIQASASMSLWVDA
jgi:hypothetical protein